MKRNMKKLIVMTAIAAISFGSVFANTVKHTMQTDTTKKAKTDTTKKKTPPAVKQK